MPSVHRLTKSLVDALEPGSKTKLTYDGELAGFGVRVTPAGAKSWIVEYRAGGGGRTAPKRRMTLGSVKTITADQARRTAKDILARARLGEDPAAELAEDRRAATVADLSERFLDHVRATKKPRTGDLYEIYFRKHVLPALGPKRARDVTPRDVDRLHKRIGQTAPITANRVIMLLSGFFRWAGKGAQGEVPRDFAPTADIERFREAPRERYLTPDEFARLGDAIRQAETVGVAYEVDEARPTAKHARKPENRLRHIDPHAAGAIRLLLFTGARLREILHLRWDEVDFSRGVLWLADSKTGRKPIVLNAPALAVLSSLQKLRIGHYVIAGAFAGRDDEKPRTDLKKPWALVSERAGLSGVRIHDLRHSFASVGAGEHLGLPVIGKLLGHRNPETTQRYAHLADDPLRRASERIAAGIAARLGEPVAQSADVIPLNPERQTKG
ncbi:MAG: tyrosine-type recombinase/integrase [Pseudolabrys sp.]|nr:tyrosine-type recombinase/integrase [Pseudolabrys sp.]